MTLNKVRSVAKRIIRINQTIYPAGFINIIPAEILNTEMTDDNLNSIGDQIDQLRFVRFKELAKVLGLPTARTTWTKRERKLYRDKCKDLEKLPYRQRRLILESGFLLNVAATVIHQ